MISPPIVSRARRELARRVSGGIELALYWDAADNSTSIELWQPAVEERFAVTVPPERALEAFYHPFAHLPVSYGGWFRAHEAGARW